MGEAQIQKYLSPSRQHVVSPCFTRRAEASELVGSDVVSEGEEDEQENLLWRFEASKENHELRKWVEQEKRGEERERLDRVPVFERRDVPGHKKGGDYEQVLWLQEDVFRGTHGPEQERHEEHARPCSQH